MKRIHWAVLASFSLLLLQIPVFILVLDVDSYWAWRLSIPFVASLGFHPIIFVIALMIEIGRKVFGTKSKSAIANMLVGVFMSGVIAIATLLGLGPLAIRMVNDSTQFQGQRYFIARIVFDQNILYQCNSSGFTCVPVAENHLFDTFHQIGNSVQVLDQSGLVVYTFDNGIAGLVKSQITCDLVTEIPLSECEALASLYTETNGNNWVGSSNWLKTNSPCNWDGVTCKGGNITEVDRSFKNLHGTIPPELGSLTELTMLDLSGNDLGGPIPPELGSLVSLTSLDLSNNLQLAGPIPPELGNLINLTSLELFNTDLSGSIPPELGNLTKLTHFALSSTEMSQNIPPELGNLGSLAHLDLAYNHLDGPIPPELSQLAKLEHLNLEDNNLSGSIPPKLGNLANLKYLNLSENDLSGNIPAELGDLVNLEILFVWDNNLSGPIPPELGQLLRLERLSLSDNNLSGKPPPTLGHLLNLEYLTLFGNQLNGPLPENLTSLRLYSFSFENTDLCEPSDTDFQEWLNSVPNLKRSGMICQ